MAKKVQTTDARACQCNEKQHISSRVVIPDGAYLQWNCLSCGSGWTTSTKDTLPPQPKPVKKLEE